MVAVASPTITCDFDPLAKVDVARSTFPVVTCTATFVCYEPFTEFSWMVISEPGFTV